MQDETSTPDAPQGATAPAEPAAPQGDTTTAAAASDDGPKGGPEQEAEGETGSEDKPRDERGRFKGTQARIDELTKKAYTHQREAAYWRSLAEQKAPDAAATPAAAPKPTPDQFPSYDEFVDAVTEWKADQKVAEAFSKRDEAAARRADEQALQAHAQTFAERASLARTALPDFDAVVGSSEAPMSAAIQEVILESDVGPQLAYHLAKHPDEAARISALPPTAAARELGRLEASLAKPSAPVAPAPKAPSKAPAPERPIGAGATRSMNPAQMPMDEYRAWRKSQGARWAN